MKVRWKRNLVCRISRTTIEFDRLNFVDLFFYQRTRVCLTNRQISLVCCFPCGVVFSPLKYSERPFWPRNAIGVSTPTEFGYGERSICEVFGGSRNATWSNLIDN